MDDEALVEGLCAIVARIVGAPRVPADAGAGTVLGDGGLWLDSMELLQVVIACEAQFGITFKPAEDLLDDGLQTLGTLADVIRRRSRDLSRATSAPEVSS